MEDGLKINGDILKYYVSANKQIKKGDIVSLGEPVIPKIPIQITVTDESNVVLVGMLPLKNNNYLLLLNEKTPGNLIAKVVNITEDNHVKDLGEPTIIATSFDVNSLITPLALTDTIIMLNAINHNDYKNSLYIINIENNNVSIITKLSYTCDSINLLDNSNKTDIKILFYRATDNYAHYVRIYSFNADTNSGTIYKETKIGSVTYETFKFFVLNDKKRMLITNRDNSRYLGMIMVEDTLNITLSQKITDLTNKYPGYFTNFYELTDNKILCMMYSDESSTYRMDAIILNINPEGTFTLPEAVQQLGITESYLIRSVSFIPINETSLYYIYSYETTWSKAKIVLLNCIDDKVTVANVQRNIYNPANIISGESNLFSTESTVYMNVTDEGIEFYIFRYGTKYINFISMSSSMSDLLLRVKKSNLLSDTIIGVAKQNGNSGELIDIFVPHIEN